MQKNIYISLEKKETWRKRIWQPRMRDWHLDSRACLRYEAESDDIQQEQVTYFCGTATIK